MRLSQYILASLFLLSLPFYVSAQLPELEIWEIQGAGLMSPYKDSLVVAPRNIVTLVTEDRFFIQTPPDRTDNDDLTSDGIMVYVGDQVSFQIGDLVTVTGRIQEYFNLTEFGPDELSFSIDSSGLTLPEPFLLNETIPSGEIQTIPDLEKLEGMRVEFDDATTTGPSNDRVLPITLKDSRPFREPGIKYPGTTGLPVWDGNPEIIQLNLNWSAGAAEYSTGMIASGFGVLTFSNGIYQIIPDEVTVIGENVLQAVREKQTLEATIGSLNCFVFTNTASDFSIRNSKIANYIIDQLNAPDILAVQEVRNLSTLQDLADKINEIRPDINYAAYLELGNQSGSFQINNGFLVRNTIQDVQISQWAKNEVLSTGGSLHDRPPLLLEGEFRTDPPTPIKVLNLHLRSLGGIEGNNADFVRIKRHEAAISVANIIRDLQFNNLVIVGDFNAFQFSDGYVDVLAQLSGTPSLGAEYPVQEIIETPLANHSLSVPAEQQYSYIFNGNAQILDHCLSTELENLTVNELQYARGNSDNPDSFVDNSFVPYRASDHDGFVLFLGLNDSISVAANDLHSAGPILSFNNPFKNGSTFRLQLETPSALQLELIDNLGRPVFREEWSKLAAGTHQFSPNWELPPGLYYLMVKGKGFILTERVVLVNR